ncbi:MAG: hypothetical protein JW947_06735 [Sedimentisphaerales bacterium]|nr:hypothetical protein [Sedimentisphaerales bacterium]
MRELSIIEKTANRILHSNPGPVVRYRLLRDVLRNSADDCELIRARKDLSRSRHFQELKHEQLSDGSWGRFHSGNHGTKRRIPTTEIGVNRAIAIGLKHDHFILRKTVRYIIQILKGRLDFPDPPEKNDRWATGIRLLAASTLSSIQPNLSVLDGTLGLWLKIAHKTFASGKYDADAEIYAHRELTSATVKNSYLTLGNKYQLILLGSRTNVLSPKAEKALLTWVWNKQNGIGYLCQPLYNFGTHLGTASIERWLTSIEIFSRFKSWRPFANKAIDWLWDNRNQQQLWDFGPAAKSKYSYYFPLSDNWHRKQSRQNDWSVRILALLRNYYD